ncbi:hypothetical protein BD779DRAFT_1485120 [Infundibulicybe gibba]|nr:hypothetical protein BD779DRAFT_1485120 [Infundibulicybe gibba]
MVEPVAKIRSYVPPDNRSARFSIGKSNMESLAAANNYAYTHPLTIAIWLALSGIFIEYMGWWPDGTRSFLGYLSPLPALASVAVPILALADWINRPYFEKQVQDILRKPDIVDISTYYSRSPASGFWILNLNDIYVGHIALDASQDSMSTEVFSKDSSFPKMKKGTAKEAMIRHFYVDEFYRRSDIQTDLLKFAVNHAFETDKHLQRIYATDSPLIPYARACLREAGFRLEQTTETVGVFRWKLGMRILERKEWEARQTKS